jgi:hypothetical protein
MRCEQWETQYATDGVDGAKSGALRWCCGGPDGTDILTVPLADSGSAMSDEWTQGAAPCVASTASLAHQQRMSHL